MDREAWRAVISWGRKESDTTEQLNWTDGNSIFKFWGTTTLFSIVAVPFYIPVRNLQDPYAHQFLVVVVVVVCLYDYGHASGLKWYLMVLICILLITNDAEYLFVYLLAISISFLEKFIQAFCSFFNWVAFLFAILLREFFIYPKYKSFIRYVIHKYFLPFCNFFHFLDSVLMHRRFKNFFFYFLYFLVSYLSIHCQSQSNETFPCVFF